MNDLQKLKIAIKIIIAILILLIMFHLLSSFTINNEQFNKYELKVIHRALIELELSTYNDEQKGIKRTFKSDTIKQLRIKTKILIRR